VRYIIPLKNLLKWVLFCSVIIAGCEKQMPEKIEEEEPAPIEKPYDLEVRIREKFDRIAVFEWSEYERLLNKLSGSKFLVLPLNEMRTTYNSDKVVVGLRHDVDHNIYKAIEMAKIEKSKGFRSTYFILATAEYFGKIDTSGLLRHKETASLVTAISETGSEIGIHNDLLSVWMLYNLDPYKFNADELSFYRSLKIPIYGSAAHGSSLGKVIKIACYELFSDFAKRDSIAYDGKYYRLGKRSLQDYGFAYEAYAVDYGYYYSDSGGDWHDMDGLDGILKKLDDSKPGDRVQILAHPDWYGKKYTLSQPGKGIMNHQDSVSLKLF
jgi:hypothetical protein